MKVKEIMTTRVITVPEDATVADVAAALRGPGSARYRCWPAAGEGLERDLLGGATRADFAGHDAAAGAARADLEDVVDEIGHHRAIRVPQATDRCRRGG